MKLRDMNRQQLQAAYDFAEAIGDEKRRRKVGGRLDKLDGFECEYTFSHTMHWCGHRGCRAS
jgi:hypothetical protein